MFFPVNGDPYYNNVSLLLPMTGENNSTTFTDYSPSPKTITRAGDTKISTSQSKWGNGSGYFDGTGDYLSLADSTDFDFGTDPFTIELWVYPVSLANSPFIFHQLNSEVTADSGWFVELDSNAVYFGFGVQAASFKTFNVTLGTNAWKHIAVTRSGTTVNVFGNGSSPGSQTLTGADLSYNKTTPIVIGGGGASYFTAYNLNGYLQDVRVTKGVVLYTADFTPPAAPFSTPELPVRSPITQFSFNQIARLGL